MARAEAISESELGHVVADWFDGFAMLYVVVILGWLLLSNAKTRMLRRWILRRRRPDIASMSTDELWSLVASFGYTSASEYSTSFPDCVKDSVGMKVEGQDVSVAGKGNTLRAALLDAVSKALVIEQKLAGLDSMRPVQAEGKGPAARDSR